MLTRRLKDAFQEIICQIFVRVQSSFSQINMSMLIFSDIRNCLECNRRGIKPLATDNVPSHVLADYRVISKSAKNSKGSRPDF
jgi:hypothetical protein